MAVPKRGSAQPVRFVGQDAAGLPVKRKQVHQACESCKRRKVNAPVYSSSSHPPADNRDRNAAIMSWTATWRHPMPPPGFCSSNLHLRVPGGNRRPLPARQRSLVLIAIPAMPATARNRAVLPRFLATSIPREYSSRQP